MFATVIGKYFYNSVREDGLVTIASGGLIFGKGEAGTVQEVFQDATLNYYRSDYTPTPMVFLGKDFWHPAKYDGSTPAPLDPLRKPVYPHPPSTRSQSQSRGLRHRKRLPADTFDQKPERNGVRAYVAGFSFGKNSRIRTS